MRKANIALWILQAFLALFFLAASGGPKLLLPVEQLPMPIVLPDLFVRAIGACEWLGALGLILPGLTRVRPNVTVAAALGLVALTLCATTYQLVAGQPGNAVFALIMCALCAITAYGRARVARLPERNAIVLQAV